LRLGPNKTADGASPPAVFFMPGRLGGCVRAARPVPLLSADGGGLADFGEKNTNTRREALLLFFKRQQLLRAFRIAAGRVVCGLQRSYTEGFRLMYGGIPTKKRPIQANVRRDSD